MNQTFPGILIIFLALGVTACSENEEKNSVSSMINSSLETMERDSHPGADLTLRKCGTCHDLKRNIRKVGPSLLGIVGSAPTISDVPFEIWDEKSLDLWIEDPVAIKPGTMMAITGIKSKEERTAIIEYLKLSGGQN